MKALYAVILATTLMSSLSGCGKKKSSGGDGNNNPPASTADQAPTQSNETPSTESPSSTENKSSPKSETAVPANQSSSPAAEQSTKITKACVIGSGGCNQYVFSGKSSDSDSLIKSFKDACVGGTWASSCSAPSGGCVVGVVGRLSSASVSMTYVPAGSADAVKKTCEFMSVTYVPSL
jgi:hypothetical protein